MRFWALCAEDRIHRYHEWPKQFTSLRHAPLLLSCASVGIKGGGNNAHFSATRTTGLRDPIIPISSPFCSLQRTDRAQNRQEVIVPSTVGDSVLRVASVKICTQDVGILFLLPVPISFKRPGRKREQTKPAGSDANVAHVFYRLERRM